MMQTAQPWHGYDLEACNGILFRFTTGRRSLIQRKMRSVVVVVADVLIHEALQMPFIENDHVVEQIPAAVADPALGNAVLPRTAEAGLFRLDAEALHRIDHFAD
jgi:hypothetical protein